MKRVKSTSYSKTLKHFLLFILLIFTEFIIFIFSFRFIRDTFTIVPILEGDKSSVGYSQFFGYPFYMDTVIFIALLICPILFVVIIKVASDRWE